MNPETTSGGRSLPFYASIRINIRPGEKIPDPTRKDEVMGHVVNVRVVKNKTARPFRQASFPLFYGVGVDRVAEVADLAVLAGAVTKAGSWLRIQDGDSVITRRTMAPNEDATEMAPKDVELKFQGKDRFVEYLRQDNELFELLKRTVYGGTVTADEYRNQV